MTHRKTIASVLLLVSSLLGACAHRETTPDTLIIPPGTTTGGIDAKPEPPLYTTRSESLGAVIDPGPTAAPETTVTTDPTGSVTVITAPVASSTTPAVTQPQSIANGGYGPWVGDLVAAPGATPRTVITH